MASSEHMSIEQATALGEQKVKELMKNEAKNQLVNMSIAKAESMGTDKINDLLNMANSDTKDTTKKEDEQPIIIDNVITLASSNELIKRFGIRQDIVVKNSKEDSLMKARRLLSDNSNPTEEITVNCIGNLDYRVGFGVHMYLPFLPKYYDCFMYVKEVEHEWLKGSFFTSELTLTPSRVMDEQEWSDLEDSSEDEEVRGTNGQLWEKIYGVLKQQIGKPYVWSAKGPDSFDCSGLVYYCYNQFKDEIGITLGRTTYDLVKQGKEVTSSNIDEWQAGDLVFPHAGHVVVYTGNKKCIEAMQTGTNVMEHNYTRTNTYAVRRVLPEAIAVYGTSSVDIPSDAINYVKTLCEDAVSATIRRISEWKSDLISIAKEFNVDPYILLAIISIESNGDSGCISGAGAVGLCQIMTSNTYGENIYDNKGNMRAGCKCYNEKCTYFNYASTFIGLEAYNGGQGFVEGVLKKIGKSAKDVGMKEYMDACNNEENKYYACKVLYAYSLLKDKKVLS